MKEVTLQVPDGKTVEWREVNGCTIPVLIDEVKEDTRPIMERVKTFEDACAVLGEHHPYYVAYRAFEFRTMSSVSVEDVADVLAYMKLRIIAAALNEGWKPQFTKEEYRWYPWFSLYTEEEINNMSEDRKKEIGLVLWGGAADDGSLCGLACAYSISAFSYSYAAFGARLAVKSSELAKYFGRQFINIWADYVFKSQDLIKNK